MAVGVAIRDPRAWDTPAFTYRIGGIPDCSLSTSSDPGATMERTEIGSHSLQISHKGSSREGLSYRRILVTEEVRRRRVELAI